MVIQKKYITREKYYVPFASPFIYHQFSRDNIFKPLGMNETGYLPCEELKKRAAPTEQRNGTWIQGEVHDPRSWLLGGIAGNAGLFSTAEDLAIYAHMLINNGKYSGVRILSPRTVAIMTKDYKILNPKLPGFFRQ